MEPAEKSDKRENFTQGLARVYGDTQTHIDISRLISTHLTKTGDIRKTALHRLDLSGALKILDLGCGFGYFTEGLKGVADPAAEVTGIDLHPGYNDFFMNSCRESGLKGRFFSGGVATVKQFENRSFDLIISSFSLYFFPEYIPHISRLLKNDGHFVSITHAVPHMFELTSFIKEILREEGVGFNHELPFEALVRNFSSENGEALLAPWFKQVKKFKCKSNLVFKDGEIESLLKYIRFKESFFLPDNDHDREVLMAIIARKIEKEMKKTGQFSITKDDVIFICAEPVSPARN